MPQPQTLGLGTRMREMHAKENARPLNTTIEGDEAILVRRTLRSGYKLEHPGHVTVIGDVNPGAEITAGGSILIWGRMRGVAHAGAEGDEARCRRRTPHGTHSAQNCREYRHCATTRSLINGRSRFACVTGKSLSSPGTANRSQPAKPARHQGQGREHARKSRHNNIR